MTTKNRPKILLLVSVMFLFYIYFILPSVLSWGPIDNYRNYSVRTTVNVTDAMPQILNISCNNGTDITLSAGTTYRVNCLVELLDYNGGVTLNGTNGSGVVNSTFFYNLNASDDPDDNNVHYTNESCSLNGTPSGWYVNWSCSFDVWYYANNGSWVVNISVLDTYNQRNYSVNGSGSAEINPLYALNLTDVIDFGDMYVGETSATSIEANITNFGNMDINVSLYGYGGENQTLYPTVSMVCDVRNLSLDLERYSMNSTDLWAGMTAITGSPVDLPNLTITQQQDDATPVVNSTYWRLYVDPTDNPFGVCNGTVVFSAESST